MNHRAEEEFEVARKSIYWIIASVLLIMVLFAFTVLVAGYQNKLTAIPPPLKAELLSLRFIDNADCFAYQDQNSERVISGSIDLAKFNTEQLHLCYKTDQETGRNEFHFRLRLESGIAPEIHTNKYFNVDSLVIKRPVSVYAGDTITFDTLYIYVQEKVRVPR